MTPIIRVSTIESFRYFCDTEWGDFACEENPDPETRAYEELISYIRNHQQGTPSMEMDAGTAFHACMDDMLRTSYMVGSGESQYQMNRSGDFRFNGDYIKRLNAWIGNGIKEERHTKAYDTDHGVVHVTGKIDHKIGIVGSDYKLTFGQPDARRYESSMQWRFYMDLADLYKFRYVVVKAKGQPDDSGYVELEEPLVIPVFRYEGMKADIRASLDEFMAWATANDLVKYLDHFKE